MTLPPSAITHKDFENFVRILNELAKSNSRLAQSLFMIEASLGDANDDVLQSALTIHNEVLRSKENLAHMEMQQQEMFNQLRECGINYIKEYKTNPNST